MCTNISRRVTLIPETNHVKRITQLFQSKIDLCLRTVKKKLLLQINDFEIWIWLGWYLFKDASILSMFSLDELFYKFV